MDLDDELDLILARRDRQDMQPTIDALLPILATHPENPRVLYEVGGAHDTAGEEAAARDYYEKALVLGLDDDLLMRCYVQYGSTLRNLGELEESRAVFSRARTAFPDSPALGVFEAITLHAQERPDEAVASLLELITRFVPAPDIERYTAAILANAAHIRSTSGPKS